jgi:hypothetical protein
MTGAILSAVCLLLAIAHLASYAESGAPIMLLFVIGEICIAVFFLLRIPTRHAGKDASRKDPGDPQSDAMTAGAPRAHSGYPEH